MLGFFDHAYLDLTERAKFSRHSAWILIGRYCHAIFKEQLPFRQSSGGLDDPTTLDARSKIFWSVLQSHRIMKDLIRLEFSAHTAIIREQSAFTLVDRVSTEEVNALKRSHATFVESVQKRLKTLEADVQQLQKQQKIDQNANAATSNSLKQHLAKHK